MADDVIYGAIKDYVSGSFTRAPIAWENESFTRPSDGSPWLIFEITGSLYAQTSIGESPQGVNRYDQEGVMFFHVLVLKGTGSATARQIAKQIADLFRGTQLLDDNLEFVNMTIGEGQPSDESGTHYRISVSIDWRLSDSG